MAASGGKPGAGRDRRDVFWAFRGKSRETPFREPKQLKFTLIGTWQASLQRVDGTGGGGALNGERGVADFEGLDGGGGEWRVLFDG